MRIIDADANIETMKKCAANPESEQALLCYRFAQRILEEAPTVEPASPWHRVEEPPKENGAYAVCWKGSNSWGKLFYCGEWLATPGTPFPDYWMPIEPPKEE